MIRDTFLAKYRPLSPICHFVTSRCDVTFLFFPKNSLKTYKNRTKCKNRALKFWKNDTWHFGRPPPLPSQECHVLFEWTTFPALFSKVDALSVLVRCGDWDISNNTNIDEFLTYQELPVIDVVIHPRKYYKV